MRILYLVHDLSDPAVRKRVRMLQVGGADVRLAGFRRSPEPPSEVEGVVPVDFGRTEDARLLRRAASVAEAWAFLGRWADLFREAEVVVARNLEMLALGSAGRERFNRAAPLAYECLDVHRLMASEGTAGRLLRGVERRLASACGLLIVSSPAFLERYFVPRDQAPGVPTLLVENKPFAALQPAPPPRAPGPPWRLGWFGAIRCPESFARLAAAAKALDGRLEVVIRGRPTPAQFPDFEALAAAAPHVRFEGPYRNPEDLPEIYGEVHFAWAADFYEAGLNSTWLLPNRLYESGAYGAVPIALKGVETGRRLDAAGLGVNLETGSAEEVAAFFETVTPAAWSRMAADVAAAPRETWVCTPKDCRDLVAALSALRADGLGRAAA